MSDLKRVYRLNESFGPQPPKPTGSMRHLDVARLRGRAWFYNKGQPASDDVIRDVIRMSSAPAAIEKQMVEAWKAGEKEQQALSAGSPPT